MKINKKGQQNFTNFVLIAALVLAVLNMYNVNLFGAAVTSPAQQTTQVVTQALANSCDDSSITVKYGPQSERWTPTASVSGEEVYVWRIPYNQATQAYSTDKYDINTAVGSKSDSATDTVAFKDKMAFMYGYLSAVYWQSYVKDIIAPCNTFQSASLDSGRAALLLNGTVTFKAIANDGSVKYDGRLAGDNESMGAGDTGKFNDITIETADKIGFAPSTVSAEGGEFLAIVEVNKSMYKEERMTLGDKQPNGATPSFYTPGDTNHATRTWKFKGCPDVAAGQTKCSVVLGQLYVETETGEDPVGGGTIGRGDISICLVPGDWFLDTRTFTPKYGFEKDDGTIAASGLYGSNGVCYNMYVN